MSTQPSATRLFVSNLAWTVTDDVLQKHFSRFGELAEASVQTRKTDGKSRGFAFVRFTNAESASTAREQMHGHILNDRKLAVEFSKSRPKPAKKDSRSSSRPHKRSKTSPSKSVDMTDESKSEAEPPIDNAILREVNSTMELALKRLREGSPTGKNRFRNSCQMLLKCIEETNGNASPEFVGHVMRIFEKICEVANLCYGAMEKSGDWQINPQQPPAVAKTTVEKIYEFSFHENFRPVAASMKAAFDRYETTMITRANAWERAQVECMDDEVELDQLWQSMVFDENNTKDKNEFVNSISQIVKEKFPLVTIQVYGSWLMGLQFKNSDIDLGLDFSSYPKSVTASHDDKVDTLYVVSKALRDSNIKNSLITTSRVPLIVLKKHIPPCDISIFNPQNIRRAELIKAYVAIDPRVKPLILCVKLWAKKRDIGDARMGTLTSFAYINCVIQFLQITSPPVVPVLDETRDTLQSQLSQWKISNTQTLVELFQNFFQCFAKTFVPQLHRVNIKHHSVPQEFEKISDKKSGFPEKQQAFMQIRDPIIECDNLARMIRKPTCRRICREFLRAHIMLGCDRPLNEVFNSADSIDGPKYRKLFS